MIWCASKMKNKTVEKKNILTLVQSCNPSHSNDHHVTTANYKVTFFFFFFKRGEGRGPGLQ